MKPWYEVLGVDEQAPWPLVEHAYLDKWAALKSKAFPTEAEKQQLETLETAFRQAKQRRREKPEGLMDASEPDGTKRPPVDKPVPISKPIPEEEPIEEPEPEEEEVPEPEEIPNPEPKDVSVGCLAGYGTAALVILGIAGLLLGMMAMGVSEGVAGLLLVFGIPTVLFVASNAKKQRKPKNVPFSKVGIGFLLGTQALATLAVFWVGSLSKINVFVLLLLYAAGFVPFFVRKQEPTLSGWMFRALPSLLLSAVLFLNYFGRGGEPQYEQYRVADGQPGDRTVLLLENDAYYYMPGLRIFFDNDMWKADYMIFVFRQGLFGIPVRETYYIAPFYLPNISSDPLENIPAINEDEFREKQKEEGTGWTVVEGPGLEKMDSTDKENLKRLLRDSLNLNY